jgi:hypothetical protein
MLPSLIRFIRWLVIVGSVAAGIAAATLLRDRWLPFFEPAGSASVADETDHGAAGAAREREVLELSPQARKNLGIVSRPAVVGDYRRTILVPGEITDRPGISDRGVTSPAVGIITQVHAFPGDTVRPGTRLFTLRMLSEYVHTAQAELFKAVRDTELEQEKRTRLAQIGEGTIAGARLIEIDQQLRRLAAEITSRRQELIARGLLPEQIAEVEAGRFVSTVEIVAPPPVAAGTAETDPVYEVQELEAGCRPGSCSPCFPTTGCCTRWAMPSSARRRRSSGRSSMAGRSRSSSPRTTPTPGRHSGRRSRSGIWPTWSIPKAGPSTSSCRSKTSPAATPRKGSRSRSGDFVRGSGCVSTCRSRSSAA